VARELEGGLGKGRVVSFTLPSRSLADTLLHLRVPHVVSIYSHHAPVQALNLYTYMAELQCYTCAENVPLSRAMRVLASG
jgi:hypothetical protein